MKRTMKRPTNWDRYYRVQTRDPELRQLVEDELKALRVGAQLARLRQRRRLTQTRLAALAGMSAPNLSRIETSPSQNLTLGTLVRVARAMDYEPHITFKARRGVAAPKL